MKSSALALLSLLVVTAADGQVSSVKRDQEIIFFPSVAQRAADGKTWDLEIRGCVYEPDQRWLALALLRGMLALEQVRLSELENTILTERARLFMVDHKGG